jgi:hypothetical protein
VQSAMENVTANVMAQASRARRSETRKTNATASLAPN